jgi:hypothetical protein
MRLVSSLRRISARERRLLHILQPKTRANSIGSTIMIKVHGMTLLSSRMNSPSKSERRESCAATRVFRCLRYFSRTGGRGGTPTIDGRQ